MKEPDVVSVPIGANRSKAEAVAEKIAQRAADALAPLHREMEIMQWKPEFRAIMWGAVSHHAAILEAEQRSLADDHTRSHRRKG